MLMFNHSIALGMTAALHWIAVVSGVYITPGQYSVWYNFWSGIGSDIGEFAIAGALVRHTIVVYKTHECHVDSCHRIGLHPVAGTPYVTCRQHHPTVPLVVTAEHINSEYRSRDV